MRVKRFFKYFGIAVAILLGRVITNKDGRKIVWHDDGTYGLAIFVGFDSYSEKDVAVLTNSQEIADKIGMDILDESILQHASMGVKVCLKNQCNSMFSLRM